ncbi:MAG: hypothetical protein L0Z51_07855 [Candidatus Latescibacteria bacterium]|nr:hypothetical protein [Candidatus Latescibacterota bacterium]
MDYNVPIYDPYVRRGDGYYHPGNDEATLLLHVQHSYRDLAILLNTLSRLEHERARRLITKYAILELFSLDANIRQLANMVIRGRTEFHVTPEQTSHVKALRDAYDRSWRQHESTLTAIRHKLAAHREPVHLLGVVELWDSVNTTIVTDVIRHVPPLHDFIKDLNIFKWTITEMTESGEVTGFIQPFDGTTLTIPMRQQRATGQVVGGTQRGPSRAF